jgi:hypothetical protein
MVDFCLYFLTRFLPGSASGRRTDGQKWPSPKLQILVPISSRSARLLRHPFRRPTTADPIGNCTECCIRTISFASFAFFLIRPGTTFTVPLRLQNYGLAPEQYQLSVAGAPSDWTVTLLGGGL